MPTLTVNTSDNRSFDCYLALPEKRPAPGVVVLQEIFGVNKFVREIVDHLAMAGFAAIAPDLFWRINPGIELDESERDQAQSHLKNVLESTAVEDSLLAMDALRHHPACNGKVGAVGYCWGGKIAYLMAARSNVDAAVSYYGVGIQTALTEAANIRTPVLLHIAGADVLCPPVAQEHIIAATRECADYISVEVYQGAGHAFARRGGAPYMAIHAERANDLTTAFLNKHLGPLRVGSEFSH
jgi:carboxymethylenebutenolidase